MFKKYKVPADTKYPGGSQITFFVYSRDTKSGFLHEAVMLGLPSHRLGVQYPLADDNELFKLRYKRVSYINRTWERWVGQNVLKRLWEQLGKVKKDFPVFALPCPFDGDEPDHEDIFDPDELFGRFRRRK